MIEYLEVEFEKPPELDKDMHMCSRREILQVKCTLRIGEWDV